MKNRLDFMAKALEHMTKEVFLKTGCRIKAFTSYGEGYDKIASEFDPTYKKEVQVSVLPFCYGARRSIAAIKDPNFTLTEVGTMNLGGRYDYNGDERVVDEIMVVIHTPLLRELEEKHAKGVDVSHQVSKVITPNVIRYCESASRIFVDVFKILHTDTKLSSILAKNYGIGDDPSDSVHCMNDEHQVYGTATTSTRKMYKQLTMKVIDVMVMWYVNELVTKGKVVEKNIVDTINSALLNLHSFHSINSVGFISSVAEMYMASDTYSKNIFAALVNAIKDASYDDPYNEKVAGISVYEVSNMVLKNIEKDAKDSDFDAEVYGESIIMNIAESADVLDVDFETYMEACVCASMTDNTIAIYGESIFRRRKKDDRSVRKEIVEIKRELYQCEREFEFMADERSKELALDRCVDLIERIDYLEDDVRKNWGSAKYDSDLFGASKGKYAQTIQEMRDEAQEILTKGRTIDVKRRRNTLHIAYPDDYQG